MGVEKQNMDNESWFDFLKMPTFLGLREDYSWLKHLPSRVERIANFGCYSCVEPFKLIWTLNAKEITIVEIEQNHIEEFLRKANDVKQQFPESMKDRTIKCICADMTTHIPQLPDQYYDLAYCEDVLYTLQNIGALERGISQMIRVVKSNGFIVAVEPKFGAQYKTRIVAGVAMAIPNTASDPKDMSHLFATKGLKKLEIPGCPPYTYCYQRNSV
jgi:SAM-dependent methyltransferase